MGDDDVHTQTAPRRWQNFDALRLIAASAVVLSHSFLLSSAGYLEEPFVRLFGDGKDLGVFAVGVFFVISGFLITQSYTRRASARSYLVNRVLRIFPGLLVCTLFTAVVVAPMFSPSPVQTLISGDTWQYVWRTVLLQPLGGSGFPVEMYDGSQGTMMLGTTWSLAPEFACYIGVLLLGSAGLLRLPVAACATLVGLWAHRSWDLPIGNHLAWALVFFAAGSTLYFVHERGRPGRLVVAGSAVAFLLAAAAGEPLIGLALFGSIGLVQLATSERIVLPDLARAGDLSYGVYLYGWPAQQVVRALWGPTVPWWAMFLLAMPLALTAAWLSWRLVESPAQAAARRFRGAELATDSAGMPALAPRPAR